MAKPARKEVHFTLPEIHRPHLPNLGNLGRELKRPISLVSKLAHNKTFRRFLAGAALFEAGALAQFIAPVVEGEVYGLYAAQYGVRGVIGGGVHLVGDGFNLTGEGLKYMGDRLNPGPFVPLTPPHR